MKQSTASGWSRGTGLVVPMGPITSGSRVPVGPEVPVGPGYQWVQGTSGSRGTSGLSTVV